MNFSKTTLALMLVIIALVSGNVAQASSYAQQAKEKASNAYSRTKDKARGMYNKTREKYAARKNQSAPMYDQQVVEEQIGEMEAPETLMYEQQIVEEQ